jgi:hypothetical protein
MGLTSVTLLAADICWLSPASWHKPVKVICEGSKEVLLQHMTCFNSDFEEKFREAFGREMRPEERDFFGIKDDGGSTTESQEREAQAERNSSITRFWV